MADGVQPQPSLLNNQGGGGDGRDSSGGGSGGSAPSANGHSAQQPQQQQPKQENSSAANKRTPSQKDSYWFAQGDNTAPPKQQRASLSGPNDLFFGEDDKSSGLSCKDREERLRQLRDRQQQEKQLKLEELKEQAAAAQRFREQQENERRRRLEDIRMRDADRRSQVEERKRIIQQAEQDRREAVLRKNAERENRMEAKRRNEKSSIVFAFGSSTPRMLDPRDSSSNASFFGYRRATSTTNVHLADTSISRRASECSDMDLSRKRATSAHSLDRKPDGEDLMTRSMTAAIPASAARRRTDLLPAMPSLRDSPGSSRSSPRHRSPGRALSMGRLDELARPRSRNPPLAPLHETTPSSVRMNQPARTMSKSMCHLGPRPAKPQSSLALDLSGPLEKGISRSSVSLAQPPRMTRGEILRQKKLRAIFSGNNNNNTNNKSSPPAQGMHSGTVTPNSPSRPTSALSQGSNNSSQVSLRSRTSPRKPRPLSIAGSSLSSADKPRDAATLSRESRPMERKLSVGSVSSSKPARAKSAGSDRSAPATPARAPARATTPKKTPSQVKAESAAKKAVEKSKTAGTPKVKSQKSTPMQSPAVESKPLPGAKEKRVSPPKDEKTASEKPTEETPPKKEPEPAPEKVNAAPESPKPTVEKTTESQPETKVEEVQPKPAKVEEAQPKPAKVEEAQPEQTKVEEVQPEIAKVEEAQAEKQEQPQVEPESGPQVKPEKEQPKPTDDGEIGNDDQEKTLAQKAAEKPVTGYATEEEYKAALAEKRRLAREAKEKEQELERQKQLEEEEKERKEEEEYLRLMEEQKKAEEERLKKAIEEAEKQRVEDAKRKEEEEKQREEAERIEQLKRVENEERLHREEEERQARKSRVAAIMARTRGKGGSNTPTKTESKTPSEENKGFDIDMNASMTDSMINNLEAVVESQNAQSVDNVTSSENNSQQQQGEGASHPSSDKSTEPISDVSSKSSQPASQAESNIVPVEQSHSNSDATSASEKLLSGITSVKVEELHVNGDSPVPMDTTPTQSVDLLGNITGDVNTRNHNGVDTTPAQTSQGTDNLDSLDPLNSIHNTTSITPAASNFEQIIDLGQTKLSNEDAVNSNPPSPFIAFEQNLNKKQSQENTSTVPDLLL